MFVAPRPRQNSNKSRNPRSRKGSHKLKKQNSVKILSIESFQSNGNHTVRKQLSMDASEGSTTVHQMPNLQRLLSIPEVLLNATASVSGSTSGLAMCSNHSQKGANTTANGILFDPLPTRNSDTPKSRLATPRSRIINMFANREQVRPVYAPKHPIDLEGLQETAV